MGNLRKFISFIFLIIFAQIAIPQELKNEDLNIIVDNANRFAFELYSKIKDYKNYKSNNLFLSPYSISTAVAMAYVGAKGKTAEEISSVFHFTFPQEKFHTLFSKLISLTYEEKKCQLIVSNAIWGQKDYGWLKEFLYILEKYYMAPLKEVDFRSTPEEARNTINKWVEEKTKEKIKNLLPQGSINHLTRMVLTNAIYFKGDWEYKFSKEETKDMPFFISAENKIMVPMMHQKVSSGKGKFKYAKTKFKSKQNEKEILVEVLQLPYVGEEICMIILLPENIDGAIEILEDELNGEKFNKILKDLRPTKQLFNEVEIYLPKFKITQQFNLNPILSSMGMETPFLPNKADFSGMNGKKDLYISLIQHKAFVEVNEEGTEAAAATGVVIGLTSAAPSSKLIFRADHPFIFLIMDNRLGTILFMGKLINPITN